MVGIKGKSGKYTRTEEHKEITRKGSIKKYLEHPEIKNKISNTIINNKLGFQKGYIPYNKGKHISEETKLKISKNNSRYWKNKIGNNKGLKRTEDTKIKMRVSAFKYAKDNKSIICPRLGKHETFILDELEKLYNYPILRQYKIIGYHLDGYIPQLNLAIEIDEPHHKKNNILNKDIIKQNNITKELNCKFLRIEDRF